MRCSDPCGVVTAWQVIVIAVKTKTHRKRTSVDGVIIDETDLDLRKASQDRPAKRLSGSKSTVRRGTAVTASELEGLRRPSQIPGEVMFDAENPEDDPEDDIITKPKLALMRTDLDRQKDANELDDPEIESLVSSPQDN